MNLIVAVDENWGIGYIGKIQWHIKEDMAYFKSKTIDKTVIMGRKTLDSFKNGKPLKNRKNIVLTRDMDFKRDDVIVVNTIEQALKKIENENSSDVYVIGGESIYQALIPYCDKAYVTKVHGIFKADKHFLNLDNDPQWTAVHISDRLMTESGVHITFYEYQRKQTDQ